MTSSSVGRIEREVPFDGGVARINAGPENEHVLLLDADGGVMGESSCASGPTGYDAVRAFFSQFRTAALTNDRERVADSMQFPLRVNDVAGRSKAQPAPFRSVESREQFLREYAAIMTPDVLARVREADPGQVSCNWQGHDLGDGVVWAELADDGALAVWAVNVGPPMKARMTKQ